MRIDLHIHSTCSDGSCSPAEVVKLAAAGGLEVVALTDHDTVAGIPVALETARNLGVRLIVGAEFSSTRGDADIHILGYGFDPEHPAIVDHAERAGRRREERMREMVERLRSQGHAVTMDDVLAVAGEERASIGRPHLARALVNKDEVASVHEAFSRLIGDGMDAHVPVEMLDPVEAIQLILRADGTPIWAHPRIDRLGRLLPEFEAAGLAGIEVYRPWSRPQDVSLLERCAKRRGLLKTGGSDWHGPERGPRLGDFHVTEQEVGDFLTR